MYSLKIAIFPPLTRRVSWGFITLSDHVIQLSDRMFECGKIDSNKDISMPVMYLFVAK